MGVIFDALRCVLLAWVQQRSSLVDRGHRSDVDPEFVRGRGGMVMVVGGVVRRRVISREVWPKRRVRGCEADSAFEESMYALWFLGLFSSPRSSWSSILRSWLLSTRYWKQILVRLPASIYQAFSCNNNPREITC